jgi:peptidylprolyl isomerase
VKKLISFALLFTLFACSDKYADLEDGMYAEITTSKGIIVTSLFYKEAPVTVANFVTLAEGTNKFVMGDKKGKPFYDGLKFHRVIQNFMIQGGDPLGNGSGDAGYKFKDEQVPFGFDNGGLLAMANSGPGTNSSQFFITHVATPWLDGRHTIFGKVVGDGMDVVNKIVQDDAIISVKIIRKGESAKRFDAVSEFSKYMATAGDEAKKRAELEEANKLRYKKEFASVIEETLQQFAAAKAKGKKLPSGVQYYIVKSSNGEKPKAGDLINIHYGAYFSDGILLDSSVEEVAKKYGMFDQNRKIQNGYTPIPFQYGNKVGLVPGFIEGIEQLKYGEKAIVFVPSALAYGAAGKDIVPPNTDLVFEIEIVK